MSFIFISACLARVHKFLIRNANSAILNFIYRSRIVEVDEDAFPNFKIYIHISPEFSKDGTVYWEYKNYNLVNFLGLGKDVKIPNYIKITKMADKELTYRLGCVYGLSIHRSDTQLIEDIAEVVSDIRIANI